MHTWVDSKRRRVGFGGKPTRRGSSPLLTHLSPSSPSALAPFQRPININPCLLYLFQPPRLSTTSLASVNSPETRVQLRVSIPSRQTVSFPPRSIGSSSPSSESSFPHLLLPNPNAKLRRSGRNETRRQIINPTLCTAYVSLCPPPQNLSCPGAPKLYGDLSTELITCLNLQPPRFSSGRAAGLWSYRVGLSRRRRLFGGSKIGGS